MSHSMQVGIIILCILMGQFRAACDPLEYSLRFLCMCMNTCAQSLTLGNNAFAWVRQAIVSLAVQAFGDDVT